MLHLFIVDAVITVKTIAKATVSSKAGWCDCFLIFFGGGVYKIGFKCLTCDDFLLDLGFKQRAYTSICVKLI